MRRIGSLAHDRVSKFQVGSNLSVTSNSVAESEPSGRMPGDVLGPVAPPKSRRPEVLNGVRVCQATAGPWDAEQFEQPPMYWNEGEDGLKDEVRLRESRSLLTGAEVYENEL